MTDSSPNKARLVAMLKKARDLHDSFYSSQKWDHECAPSFMLFESSHIDTVLIIADMPDDGEAKIIFADKIGQEARERGCDAYIFSCESWTIPPGASRTRGERFRDRADRIEILLVEARLDTQEAAMQLARIIRSEGHPPQLDWEEPMFDFNEGKIQSRFNIFRPREIDDPEFPDNRKHYGDQFVNALRELLKG